MTPQSFEKGMSRLRDQWPTSYGEERTKVIHADFKDVSDMVWTDAVTEVLATCRATPLVTELERAVEAARLREKESQAQRAQAQSIGDVMNNAARNGRSEMAKACMDAYDYFVKQKLDPHGDEWKGILIHLGKLCGMTPRQATERPPWNGRLE